MGAPDMVMGETVQLVDEYERVVNSVYGIYLDATVGFAAALKRFEDTQREGIVALANETPQHANLEYLDAQLFLFGRGDPNDPDHVELHRVTQGEYKVRNQADGLNYREIGNMCIISLYQYWEDHYRARIVEVLNLKKDDLLADVFGDLRRLRNSIVHHRALCLHEVNDNVVLTWFREGDLVHLDRRMFEELIGHVKSSLEELRSRSGNGRAHNES